MSDVLDDLLAEDEAWEQQSTAQWQMTICERSDDAEYLRSFGVPACALDEPTWQAEVVNRASVLMCDKVSRHAGDFRKLGVQLTYVFETPVPYRNVSEYLTALEQRIGASSPLELMALWETTWLNVKILDGIEPTNHPSMRQRPKLRDWTQVCDDPPVPWIVDGLIPEGGLVVLGGEPSAGKTLLILDAALRCAHGLDWLGHRTAGASTLYLPGEGTGGLGARLRAWRAAHQSAKQTQHYVALADGLPDLTKSTALDEMCELLDAAETSYGRPPQIVVIDTLAMAAPGADENDASSMGQLLRTLAILRHRRKVTVVVVHHTRKPQQGEPSAGGIHALRGSSAVAGAADVVMLALGSKKSGRRLEVAKARDGEIGEPECYDIHGQDTGKAKADGRKEFGPVVLPADPKQQPDPDQEREDRVVALLLKLRELGSVRSKTQMVSHLTGRRSNNLAAFDDALSRCLIHVTGTAREPRFELTVEGINVCVQTPHTPPGTGTGVPSARATGTPAQFPYRPGGSGDSAGTGTGTDAGAQC